jgi:hypothetical protein
LPGPDDWTEAIPGRLERKSGAFRSAEGLDFELDEDELARSDCLQTQRNDRTGLNFERQAPAADQRASFDQP